MASSPIPQGWDLQRIRDYSGDLHAEFLGTDRMITAESGVQSAEPLTAASVFGFHDLSLIQLVGDDEWHMGSLDQTTGAIHLWATYADFGEALRGL